METESIFEATAAKRKVKKEQKAERPSILKKLQKFKEFVAKLPRKEHEKRKEHER